MSTDQTPLATSKTSLPTAATGTKVFTIPSGVVVPKGARARATSASTGEWMEGLVKGYADDKESGEATLTMAVDAANGSGQHEDWNLDLVAAAPSATAPASGPLVAVLPAETPVEVVPTYDAAVKIPRRGVLTVAMVATKGSPMGSNWNSVSLPKDAQVLDVVEVYRSPESTGPGVLVFPNPGESIGANSVGVPFGASGDRGTSFRKVSPSLWLIA